LPASQKPRETARGKSTADVLDDFIRQIRDSKTPLDDRELILGLAGILREHVRETARA
jgi:hypothetical protein